MNKALTWLTLLVTATFVAAPFVTDPFSGFRADQLPVPQIDPPIQPAGYAFAIWGLIYAWLLISALFGVAKRLDDPAWGRVQPALIASLAIGTPWLWVANQSAIWATVLIFAMAATAIAALLRTPDFDRYILRAPIAIYAGWLTAASFVSLGSTAAGYGLITDQDGWAWIGISGALLTAALVQRAAIGAPLYGLTIVWALIGIAVANANTALHIALLAGAGIAVMTTLAIIAAARRQA